MADRPVGLQPRAANGAPPWTFRQKQTVADQLSIGGYGLFGIVGSVTLRLVRRQRLRRAVEVIDVDDLMDAFDARRAQGFLHGDWQFAIDPVQPGFLTRGVFSCYRPLVDKARAFDAYAKFYLSTSGQCYDSDAHQMSRYVDGYHREIDQHLGCRGSEMITELYVPRARLSDFMRACAFEFRAHGTDVVYGTVRLIRRDDETFLAWARQDYACVIFNLHVGHTPAGIDAAAGRGLPSALPCIPAVEGGMGSGRTVPERLVLPLPRPVHHRAIR